MPLVVGAKETTSATEFQIHEPEITGTISPPDAISSLERIVEESGFISRIQPDQTGSSFSPYRSTLHEYTLPSGKQMEINAVTDDEEQDPSPLRDVAEARIHLLAVLASRKSLNVEFNARLISLNEKMNILAPPISDLTSERLDEIEEQLSTSDALLDEIDSFLSNY